jgi:hypothetical protein
VGFWAIHPGGRRIIEEAQNGLGVTEKQAADSWYVLDNYGNMLSPSVMFVLQRIFKRHNEAIAKGEEGYKWFAFRKVLSTNLFLIYFFLLVEWLFLSRLELGQRAFCSNKSSEPLFLLIIVVRGTFSFLIFFNESNSIVTFSLSYVSRIFFFDNKASFFSTIYG